MKKILVTGASGLVGSRFVDLFKDKYEFITPEFPLFDLTNKKQVSETFDKEKPDFVINFAAYTNVSEAENQRGDKEGDCWKINVEGVRNLIETLPNKTRFIHISTDMVFPGSKEDKGPYEIDHAPISDSNKLTWYGFTKAEGERLIREKFKKNATILRIIYPFSAHFKGKLDYIRKPIELFDQGKLYPIFFDQKVSIVFVDDVARTLKLLIDGSRAGTFHASSCDTGSPFEIISYAIEKTRGIKNAVKSASLVEFLNDQKSSVRYPRFSGLSVKKTEVELGIKFKTWREMIDEFASQL